LGDNEVPLRTIAAYGRPWSGYLVEDRAVPTGLGYGGAIGYELERPTATVIAHGYVEVKGTLDVNRSVYTLEAYSGALAENDVPSRTIIGHGYSGVLGVADITVPSRTLVAHGDNPVVGRLNENVPLRSINASDITRMVGTLSETYRRTIEASGSVGQLGTLVENRAAYTMEGTSYVNVHGVLVANRAVYTLTASSLIYITVGEEQLTSFALLLNVKKQAISEYDNYPFESMTMFNGKAFGSNADGLFELTGIDDAGKDIDTEIETGKSDFGVGNVKKPWSLHMGMSGSGKIQAKLVGARSLEVTGKEATIQEGGLKIKHSRDTRSSYWGINFKNIDGANFQLNLIDLVTETLGRREDY